ncbi:MAG: type II toxin-antitoxin system RelE/ParE family toxin [Candidatus Solibacter sp.]|nr:type II toxin-antitoxin system RelE/ParE family toxin [Candidatus Solibacter sp.]
MPQPWKRALGSAWRPNGRKNSRVIFCVVRGRMVLLHGFIKKTQKTPAKDMDLALKRMKVVE